MLSDREKEGCIAILQFLPDEEVMALAQTTTAHQLVLSDRKEAIDAVITFTTDAVDLLRRKKMKRGYLFRYLAEKKIPVAGTADKTQLTRTILEVWGSDLSQEPVQQPQEQAQHIRQQHEEFQNIQQQRECEQQRQQQYQNIQQPHVCEQQHQKAQQQHIHEQQLCVQRGRAEEAEEQKLSVAFARWFYELLNAENPASGISAQEQFGAQHFYRDCIFKLLCASSGLSQTEYAGSELTSQRLRALVREEQLLLNPNLSPSGTRGQSEPHGMRQVLVCGTVHQRDTAIGIFEQQFGLIQEPVTESWKIKYTSLKVRAQLGLQGMPTLQHTSQILAIES